MLKLLMREQRESDCSSLGACMEFLIHHQVLDILSSICQADTPPGIRPYVFNFFIFLVARIQQTILPYVSVYLPMRRLLMLSTMVKASPTENQELTFITSLVSKIKASPELLPLFAHQARPGDISHCSSRRSSNASSMLDLSSLEEKLELQDAKKMLEDFESRYRAIMYLVLEQSFPTFFTCF